MQKRRRVIKGKKKKTENVKRNEMYKHSEGNKEKT